MNQETTEETHGREGARKIGPRELMRARHPDLFSDTSIDTSLQLPKAVFEYHLDTLTSRKQEYDFETFCRKLAEREICPNLRVQTGPTGGGDSKADSETYPVSAEVSERWWVGDSSAGAERWGFAFSTKKAWKPKFVADVNGIISTGRDYKRIYFFTNQFVSDKNRATLEDQLLKSAGIPVHIVDKGWIVEKVYGNDHLALAIETLGINGAREEKQRSPGPLDTARIAELEELDKQIADPSLYQGARFQLVEDCLRGALLARGLDRPRQEVDGRFAQAERLARTVGVPQQLMRVAYNRAWTAHWWYEDYDSFNQYYEQVEQYLVCSTEADDVERLRNLWHLLITAESRGLLSKEVAKSEARLNTLNAMLTHLADDKARPNNALQARTDLAFIRATNAYRSGDNPELNRIWIELTEIVDQSAPMGQFPVESLADMLHELGNIIDSAEFDGLYEKVVDVMRQRRSDGAAGNAYRERGIQKLHHDLPYEAIRWIGRAEELLTKEEYQRDLVLTLAAASYAYERAGLLWAARNKLLVAAERSLHAFARSGEMPNFALTIFQRLVWIELQLGRVPHVLQTMLGASFVATQLNLSETREAKYAEEGQLQEAVLGIHFLNVPFEILPALEKMPDALERLGLTNARCALLFALGHEKRLYSEKYFSSDKSRDDLNRFFELWQSQPAAEDIPKGPSLLEGPNTSLRSVILGSELVVVTPCEATLLGVAESLLGAVEAFLATSDEADLLPHVERFTIVLRKSVDSTAGPVLSFSPSSDGDAQIVCPSKLVFSTVDEIHGFSEWLRNAVIEIAAHQFVIRDPKAWLERVAGGERGFARAILLGNVLTIGRNAFGDDPKVRLSDWSEPDDKIYECQRKQAWSLPKRSGRYLSNPKKPIEFGSGPPPAEMLDSSGRKHTERKVISPIDIHLWDKAKWGGALFGSYENFPPALGLMFKDLQSARAIFIAWLAKWGQEDLEDALRVTIVTGISAKNPAHYAISIGPNVDLRPEDESKFFVLISRHCRMTPTSPQNLNSFLGEYRRYGGFFLAPASMEASPEFDMKVCLTKRHLHVRPAWQIGENDPDLMVLSSDDDPIIPATVADPPVRKALERVRKLRG